jgi:hypothetical protein
MSSDSPLREESSLTLPPSFTKVCFLFFVMWENVGVCWFECLNGVGDLRAGERLEG